jgi:hypothetical protein
MWYGCSQCDGTCGNVAPTSCAHDASSLAYRFQIWPRFDWIVSRSSSCASSIAASRSDRQI